MSPESVAKCREAVQSPCPSTSPLLRHSETGLIFWVTRLNLPVENEFATPISRSMLYRRYFVGFINKVAN